MNINKIKILLSFLLLAGSVHAQVNEQEYKVAFIERFTRFIEWPDEIENDKFSITIIGETPLHPALDELFATLKVKEHDVELVYTNNINDLKDADLVFISDSEKKSVKEIIAFTKNYPILTISNSKGFSAIGVHINMYKDRNHIRYEINQESIEKSNLKVSSLLLSSAKIVKTDD